MLEPCFQSRIATSSPLCASDSGHPNPAISYQRLLPLYTLFSLTELTDFASNVPERRRYIFRLLNGLVQVFYFRAELAADSHRRGDWQLNQF